MSIEEFEDTRFGRGMKVRYKGVEYPIASVDFEESLIGIEFTENGEICWVRCENLTIVEPYNH